MRDLAVYVAKGEFQILYPHSPNIYEHAQHLSFTENNMLGIDLVPYVVQDKQELLTMKSISQTILKLLHLKVFEVFIPRVRSRIKDFNKHVPKFKIIRDTHPHLQRETFINDQVIEHQLCKRGLSHASESLDRNNRGTRVITILQQKLY